MNPSPTALRLIESFFRFFGLFFVYLFTGLIFKGNHNYMIAFVLTSSFLLSFYFFDKKDPEGSIKRTVFTTFTPFLLLFIISSIFVGFERSILYIILIPVCAAVGFSFRANRRIWKPVFVTILIICSSLFLIKNTFYLIANRNSRTNESAKEVVVISKAMDTIRVDQEGISVIDFWTRTCSICFKTFPQYESIYNEYRGDSRVNFYSVIVPVYKDSIETSIEVVKRLDYSFPIYYSPSRDVERDLGFNAYPHLVIIKDGRIRYNGLLIVDKKVFVNHLSTEISRLLNE